MNVRTRFAPSPTGFLHLGGARTALFNYCFAKHYGGQFLLRIEDTDIARSTDVAKAAIIDGLSWLGLQHVEDIIYQGSRAKRHTEIAWQLLENDMAYRCYATSEELEQMRANAKLNGHTTLYDRRWRDVPPSQHPKNTPFVIRLKMPLNGEITLHDHVQGNVTIQNNHLDDMVLLRADGTPTYMLAVVVDDHDMGITHIMRGDDHLNNAFRQRALFDALNWKMPELYHIPLIHGSDGAKLSKRHGAVAIQEYRDQGILPEAMINALLRLGWSHGDQEIIGLNESTKYFNGSHLGRGASRFDMQKLLSLNSHYLRTLPDIFDRIYPQLVAMYPNARPENWHWLQKILPHLTQRAETLHDIINQCSAYFLRPSIELSAEQKNILQQITHELIGITDWNEETLKNAVTNWAKNNGVKLGDAAMPIRLALTGVSASPSVFAIMSAIGADETLIRLSK